MDLPPDVLSALIVLDLLDAGHPLVKDIYYDGPQITENAEKAKDFITKLSDEKINERQVSLAFLFMILTPDWRDYDCEVFISALRSYLGASEFNWQDVIKGLDRKNVEISKEKFLVLFNAFLPIAKEDANFDIQALWGGQWSHYETQISCLRALLACSPSELDATTIPRLRQAYDPRDLESSNVSKADIEVALRDSTISSDAATAIFSLLVPANGLSAETMAYVNELLGQKAGLFLCSLAGSIADIEKPRTQGQISLLSNLMEKCLDLRIPGNRYVLYTFWQLDRQAAAMSLSQMHRDSPLNLLAIYEAAQEMDWMDDLLTLTNGLGFDLAALVHRKGALDLDDWLREKIRLREEAVPIGIANFLTVKAEDELRTSREEQERPTTLSLAMKTVYDLLAVLERTQIDRTHLKVIQRQCLQAYPRLISYCEGITENVDVECTESNALPGAADIEMQQLYKQMYSGEVGIDYILQYLGECKASNDASKVDLFACMIHGLYDEFSCFSEYPLEPLAITAVLFGGILKVGLVSDLTLRVGQDMVLDSVRDFSPEEKMFKFGLQALIHASERFSEPEWAGYCSKLLKIPGLRGTQAYNAAAQALSHIGGPADGTNGTNGVNDELELRDDEVDGMLPGDANLHFKSVNAEQAPNEPEPNEDTEEKVVFFFNNVTEQNLDSRIGQIEDILHENYQQWFARSLVEGRAKVEPNNQGLYLRILECLSNKALWNEVLRETYVSLQRLLNAESTLQSASERKYLKNLSIWLGTLTLARDKPIKHKNIAFLDLLMEGYTMQKLVLVIPFTCNVLAQGARSQIFKPPNPWVVEIIAGLMELYKEGDIKLNQKFEIEVLFREFGLNEDSIPPSMNVRGRQPYEEDLGGTTLADGLENFDELSLGGLNRGPRNPRFDAEEMTSNLPDLSSLLHFPPASGSAANQSRLRQIVQEAVRRAIVEIVAPVVERSVTIATIATTALVHKDFATEADEDRVREAAQQMVKQLSGSLALVTSKEPLKMSMTNYIRMAQADLPEQSFAEGSILMCVNDNLDIACSIVESQAEERSMPEIEAHIENELALRRQHIADHPNEEFLGDSYSRWSSYIPDPYKMTPGGLNSEQMAIYLEFARQSRGPTNHAQTASADSGRQLPDVLQDAFSSLPSAPTPADPNAMPHQSSHQPPRPQHTRMSPPRLSNSVAEARAMGYVPYIPGMGFGNPNAASVDERVQDLMAEIKRIFQGHSNHMRLNAQQREAISELLDEIWQLIEASSDSIAMNCAENICKRLYGDSLAQQEAEVFVDLLSKLYITYPTIRTEVTEWARGQEDERLLTVDVTIPLVEKNIVQLNVVDAAMTRLIRQRGEEVVEPIAELFDTILFTERPLALRADFASTMGAIGELCLDIPDSQSLRSLVKQLKVWGANEFEESQPDEAGRLREHMLQYVFKEWTRMCEFEAGPPSWKFASAFVSQLISRQIVTSQEDTAAFLRVCIEISIDQHDILDSQSKEVPDKAYPQVDSLARMVVVLVRSAGDLNGTVRGSSKATYMDSLLAIITLVMNKHAVTRGERFNQRIFFRLWSSILNEWNDYARDGPAQDRDMLLVFANSFKALNPAHFPAFSFGWLTLIAHRVFMPALLKLANEEVSAANAFGMGLTNFSQGAVVYAELVSIAFSYIGHFLRPGFQPALAASLYQALLRVVLILHHDFPEFLAENHFRLCNAIPQQCTQLYNLVLSAYPSSFADLPNPFVTGLKTDRLEEMKKPPRLSDDYFTVLQAENLVDPIDGALRANNISTDLVSRLANIILLPNSSRPTVDISLIHAIVLYVGQSTTSVGTKSPAFVPTSAPAVLLFKLSKELPNDALYHLISSMVNQLRFPNTHTHFFNYALLHLFSATEADSNVRLQIARVLLERMHVVKPHPWGLVIITLELLKNPEYNFWGQSFVKDLPAVGSLFGKPLMRDYWD